MNTPTPTPHATCPACGRGHAPHPEFGAYCNVRCLQAGVDGRILYSDERSQPHAA